MIDLVLLATPNTSPMPNNLSLILNLFKDNVTLVFKEIEGLIFISCLYEKDLISHKEI